PVLERYGAGFAEAAPSLAILCAALAVAFVSGHHRFALIAAGRMSDDLRANAAGAVLTIAVCIALRSELAPALAAAALFAREAPTLAVAAARLAARVEWLPLARLFPPVAAAGALALPLLLLPGLRDPAWVAPSIFVPAFALIACAVEPRIRGRLRRPGGA